MSSEIIIPSRSPDIDGEPHMTGLNLAVCQFDIVNGCQLECVGCPNSTLKPAIQRISRDDFASCLANIDVDNIRLLRLYNYGEPLLHKGLAELLQEIPRQRWSADVVEISTNAQYVDWPSFEAALRTGIINRLVVSCDGDGTPADYERLRPPSRWDRFIEFLRRVGELRDQLQPDLKLMTRTICTDDTAKARWRSVVRPFGWEPEFRDWLMLPQAKENYSNAQAAQGLCLFQRKQVALYVTANGTVVPCCFHPRAAELGNLLHQTFSQIMAGRQRQDFSAVMETDRAVMPICGKCAAT